MVTSEDIEKFYSRHPNLRPPEKIYVLPDPLVLHIERRFMSGTAVIGGVTPKNVLTNEPHSAVVLTPNSDEESLVHETLHTMGCREIGAYTLGKIFTKARGFIPLIRDQKVKYRKEEASFSEIEAFGIEPVDYKPETVALFRLVK